jgi:hypothetical protein
MFSNSSSNTHSFYDFQNKHLNEGGVEKITVVNREIAEVKLKAPASTGRPSPSLSGGKEELYSFPIGSVEQFNKDLEKAYEVNPSIQRVPIMYETRGSFMRKIGGLILPLILILAMSFMIILIMNNANTVSGVSYKKFYFTALILALMATNPSTDDHKSTVIVKVKKTLEDYSTQQSIDNLWANTGRELGLSIAQAIIEKSISRDNYLIFSFTKSTFAEKDDIIGIGILGKVWLLNEAEYNDLLKKANLNDGVSKKNLEQESEL